MYNKLKIFISGRRSLVVGSHVKINGSGKGSETSTTNKSGLGTGLDGQTSTGETSGGHTVPNVVFGSQRLDATLGSGEDSTNETKVLSTAPCSLTHIGKLELHLLLEGELRHGLHTHSNGGVISHLG